MQLFKIQYVSLQLSYPVVYFSIECQIWYSCLFNLQPLNKWFHGDSLKNTHTQWLQVNPCLLSDGDHWEHHKKPTFIISCRPYEFEWWQWQWDTMHSLQSEQVVEGMYLKNDCEIHHNERCTKHQILLWDLILIQSSCESICHCPSKTTVAHYNYISDVNRNQSIHI